MGKPTKIALGIATAAPLPAMLLAIVLSLVAPLFLIGQSGAPPRDEPADWVFVALFGSIALQLLVLLLTLALVAFYMVHIFRTDRVEHDKKALWAVVIFLGNMFAMPVYWYLYVWQEPRRGGSRRRGSGASRA